MPRSAADSFEARLLAFAEDLRTEGVAIGTSELLDSFQALEHVGWTEPADFKEALASTMAKSPEDRRVFDLVFDRFFFRTAEAEAARLEITEGGQAGGNGQMEVNLETLRQQTAPALQPGSAAALPALAPRPLAALAPPARPA